MRALIFLPLLLLGCAPLPITQDESPPVSNSGTSENLTREYRWGDSDYVEFGESERRDFRNGYLERVLHFDNDQRLLQAEEYGPVTASFPSTGPKLSFFSDGRIRREINWIAGRREGRERVLFPNGVLRELSEWRFDRREGPYREFFENGRPKLFANYEQGAIDGMVKAYFESGMLNQEVVFASGAKEGLEQTYYENGKFRTRAQYHQGRLHGGMESYDEAGELLCRAHYQDGKQVDIHYF